MLPTRPDMDRKPPLVVPSRHSSDIRPATPIESLTTASSGREARICYSPFAACRQTGRRGDIGRLALFLKSGFLIWKRLQYRLPDRQGPSGTAYDLSAACIGRAPAC